MNLLIYLFKNEQLNNKTKFSLKKDLKIEMLKAKVCLVINFLKSKRANKKFFD